MRYSGTLLLTDWGLHTISQSVQVAQVHEISSAVSSHELDIICSCVCTTAEITQTGPDVGARWHTPGLTAAAPVSAGPSGSERTSLINCSQTPLLIGSYLLNDARRYTSTGRRITQTQGADTVTAINKGKSGVKMSTESDFETGYSV